VWNLLFVFFQLINLWRATLKKVREKFSDGAVFNRQVTVARKKDLVAYSYDVQQTARTIPKPPGERKATLEKPAFQQYAESRYGSAEEFIQWMEIMSRHKWPQANAKKVAGGLRAFGCEVATC